MIFPLTLGKDSSLGKEFPPHQFYATLFKKLLRKSLWFAMTATFIHNENQEAQHTKAPKNVAVNSIHFRMNSTWQIL